LLAASDANAPFGKSTAIESEPRSESRWDTARDVPIGAAWKFPTAARSSWDLIIVRQHRLSAPLERSNEKPKAMIEGEHCVIAICRVAGCSNVKRTGRGGEHKDSTELRDESERQQL
jgi:hypothetical protein